MKKGIDEQKVQRMRNLVTGDHTLKTRIRSGYTTKRIERSEGDVWLENKKTWTIKNGIKQTINKLDKFRLANQLPLVCPKCKTSLKAWRDQTAYNHFKFCKNCLAIFENKKVINGTWEEYSKSVQDANYESWLDEQYSQFKDFLQQRSNKKMISEAGDIEDWSGGLSEEKLKENFKSYIKEIEDRRNEKTR